jgi:hypothetical protein
MQRKNQKDLLGTGVSGTGCSDDEEDFGFSGLKVEEGGSGRNMPGNREESKQ